MGDGIPVGKMSEGERMSIRQGIKQFVVDLLKGMRKEGIDTGEDTDEVIRMLENAEVIE